MIRKTYKYVRLDDLRFIADKGSSTWLNNQALKVSQTLGLTPSIVNLATYIRSIDVLGCQAALYEWAESYDTKDWNRLSKCIAPVLRVRLHKPCNQNFPSDYLYLTLD